MLAGEDDIPMVGVEVDNSGELGRAPRGDPYISLIVKCNLVHCTFCDKKTNTSTFGLNMKYAVSTYVFIITFPLVCFDRTTVKFILVDLSIEDIALFSPLKGPYPKDSQH